MTHYDVAIVGGGPAGLSAAKEIAENGFSVIVLDRKQILGDKPCGGAIPLREVRELGIPTSLAEQLISHIKIVFPGGTAKTVYYDEPVIGNFDRVKLAQFLSKNATKYGTIIMTNTSVYDIKYSNKRWFLSARRNGERFTLTSHLLIGADGVPSTVLKLTKLREPFRKDQIGFSTQYHVKTSKRLECEEFYYGHEVSPFGYAWIFPHNDILRVGVGALVSKLGSVSLREYLDTFLEKYVIKRNLAAREDIVKFEAALTPLSGIVKPTYGKALLLAGDSAGHVNPISGEGIAYALKAGRIAGKIISESLKRKDFSASFLKKYEKTWINAFGSDIRWGRLLLKYFARKSHGRSKVEFILKDEKLVKLVSDILVAYDKISKLILKKAPRILIRKIIS
ncbi:MAG: geranylgeranyl reductase family protein [Candidatus Asgardarchaeia archaeon]